MGQRGGAMADLVGVSGVAATEPASQRGSVLWGQCRMMNSPKGVSSIGGDWKVAHYGGWISLELWRWRKLIVVVLRRRDEVGRWWRDPLFNDVGLAASGTARSGVVMMS
jgi:hypothetical protein